MHVEFGTETDHDHTYKFCMKHCLQTNSYILSTFIPCPPQKKTDNLYTQLQAVTNSDSARIDPMTLCLLVQHF